MTYRAKPTATFATLTIAALMLAACGRAGAPTAVTPAQPDGKPAQAQEVPDKPFVLDPLLN